MPEKPTYEELEQRVKQLEQEAEKRKQAEEALSRLREALLLLDLYMPEMDGFEVAQRAMSEPFGEKMKNIMLSSAGQRGDSARCREAGISGYLTKPVKQSDLFDAILMTMGLSAEEEPTVITRHTVYEARERLTILLSDDITTVLGFKKLSFGDI